jgi:hypothetical protein
MERQRRFPSSVYRLGFRATQRRRCNVKSIKVKHGRKALNKTPRDIIGDKNVMALKQAGFVVVHLSQLTNLRENIKSALDILSSDTPRKDKV